MALLSFVVGSDGGELPLSIEVGAPARSLAGPRPARRRPGTFAGWRRGQGSGRRLNAVGEFHRGMGREESSRSCSVMMLEGKQNEIGQTKLSEAFCEHRDFPTVLKETSAFFPAPRSHPDCWAGLPTCFSL